MSIAAATANPDDWFCPFCGKAEPDFNAEKLQFRCQRCHAVGMHSLFIKRVISRDAFARLETCFKTKPVPHVARTCPACRAPISFFAFQSADRENALGHCVPCRWTWSEGQDFLHAFSKSGPNLQEKAELNAIHQVREELNPYVTFHQPWLDGEYLSDHGRRIADTMVDEATSPIRHHDNSKAPVYTLTILIACAVTSLLISRYPALRPYFLFDPRHPLAYGGLPMVLSGLLHFTPAHFFGNALPLLLFGWVLENELKEPHRVVFVFIGSVFCGSLMHGFFAPPIPVAGASGGARGLLAYYVMLFPWTQFTVLRRVRAIYGYFRITMTSAAFFTMTLALDFLGGWATSTLYHASQTPRLPLAPNIAEVLRLSIVLVTDYLPGWYSIACMAHIGGAVFGLLCAAWGTDLLKAALLVSTAPPSRRRDGRRRNPIPSQRLSGFPNGMRPLPQAAQPYTSPTRRETIPPRTKKGPASK